MKIDEFVNKIMNKEYQINVIKYNELQILYYSNIDNLSELKKYNINYSKSNKKKKFDYCIYYVEDSLIYNELLSKLHKEKYKKIQVHSVTKYKVYYSNNTKIYLSDNFGQDYVVLKREKFIFIINYSNDNSRSLLYVIRELIRIYIENSGGLIFHSACLSNKKNNILIIGDSGCGKTTLLFQLLNNSNSNYISNDRLLLTESLNTYSYPIKIRLGKKTIENIESLKDYLNFKSVLDTNEEKVSIYPIDVIKWNKQKKLYNNNKLTKIIIPNLQLCYNNEIKKIDSNEAFNVIEKNCYTPYDPEWIERWFDDEYMYSFAEINSKKNVLLKKITSKINIYKLNYCGIIDDEILYKILEE